MLEVIYLQSLPIDYKNINHHLIVYTESLLLSDYRLRGGWVHRRGQINYLKGAYCKSIFVTCSFLINKPLCKWPKAV